MSDDRNLSKSRKISALLKRFADKAYRDQFVASRARRFLAHQMRELRGDRSQAEFGKLLDKPQSVVSRLEDPSYGKWTVQTLLDVASKVDRAVIVQFVSYDEFSLFINQEKRHDLPSAFNNAQISTVKTIKNLDKSRTDMESNIIGRSMFGFGWGNPTGEISPTPTPESLGLNFIQSMMAIGPQAQPLNSLEHLSANTMPV